MVKLWPANLDTRYIRFRIENVVGQNRINFTFGRDDGRPSTRSIRLDRSIRFLDQVSRQREIVGADRDVKRRQSGLLVNDINIRACRQRVADAGEIAGIGGLEKLPVEARAARARRSAPACLRPLRSTLDGW